MKLNHNSFFGFRAAILFGLPMLLAACGGGGSNSTDGAQNMNPPTVTDPFNDAPETPLEALGFFSPANFDQALVDTFGSSYYSSSNNSSLLLGATVGTGSTSNVDLIKPLRFVVSEADNGLVINAAYLVGTEETSHNLVLSAQNISQALACGIIITDVLGFDKEGAPVGQPTLAPTESGSWLIAGSFGRFIGRTLDLNSCLQSGESAYFLMPLTDERVESLAAVRIGRLQNSVGNEPRVLSEPSPIVVRPVSYEIRADGSAVVVTIQNFGNEPALIDDILIVYLDDRGFPMDYYFNKIGDTSVIDIGSVRRYATVAPLNFAGLSSSLRIIVDADLE